MRHLAVIVLLFNSLSFAIELQSSQHSSRYKKSNYQNSCYAFVTNLVQEGKENSSLGLIKSRYSICTKNVDLYKVQKTFGDSKSYANFLKNEWYKEFSSKHSFNLERCSNEKSTPVHEIASKYYYMMNRLQNGEESLVAQIVAVNRVLGSQATLDRLGCSESDFQKVNKVCHEGRQCSNIPES
ncbi:MAG: hypothetical protein KDD45_01855, partial [Bdellovibrionales bacterium]|nr:hypothetical protein [Bdellovibrionales bacterium]